MKRVQQRRELGRRVKALRQQIRLTQEELGQACGLFRTYIARIESGAADPTVSTLLRVADALGVPVGSLLENQQTRSLRGAHAFDEISRMP